MFELSNLQLQLQNLKVLFIDALANPETASEELREIREQIHSVQKLIEVRKDLLSGQSYDN